MAAQVASPSINCINCHRCAREIELFRSLIGSWCSGLLETLGIPSAEDADKGGRRLRGSSKDVDGIGSEIHGGGGSQLMAYLSSFSSSTVGGLSADGEFRSNSFHDNGEFISGSHLLPESTFNHHGNSTDGNVHSSVFGEQGDSELEDNISSSPSSSYVGDGGRKRQKDQTSNQRRKRGRKSSSGTTSNSASVAAPLVEKVPVDHCPETADGAADGASTSAQGSQFRCIECGNCYKSKGHALRHAKLHLFGRIKCAFCPNMYTRNDSLSMHLRKVHGKKLTDLEEGLEIEGGDDTLFPPLPTTSGNILTDTLESLGVTVPSIESASLLVLANETQDNGVNDSRNQSTSSGEVTRVMGPY